MAYGTVSADVIQSSVANTSLGAGNASIMKNRIINGAMVIDQRNAGASINNNTTGTQYSLDRWNIYGDVSSKFSVQQNAGSVTPPAGYTKYLGATSLSAYSVPSGEIYSIAQYIEGLNIADLGWGTANAKTVTLSFWVYSSLTGSFGGAIRNNASNRSYPFAYTINSANTWQQISITIAGDTTGTWSTDTAIGMRVVFSMGAGSTYQGTANTWASAYYNSASGTTNVVGTNSATFYITGVQLEVGSSATGFEYRQYGQELQLCQRYYQVSGSGASQIVGTAYYLTSTQVNGSVTFQTTMRTAPTLVSTSGTDYYAMARTNSADYFNSITLASTGINSCIVRNTTEAAGTAGDAGSFGTDNASAYIGWSAEL